jgi:hypothetical protein
VLSFASSDELPFVVQGVWSTAQDYYGAGIFFNCTAICLVILYSISIPTSGIWWLTAALAFAHAANSLLAGALRSLNNVYHEIRENAPWVLLFMLAYFFPVAHAEDVLLRLFCSYLIVQLVELVVLRHSGLAVAWPSGRTLLSYLSRIQRWIPKTISAIGVIGLLRSFPIWQVLKSGGVGDAMAFAFSVGEVAFQICMTLVNIVHSKISQLHIAMSPAIITTLGGIFLVIGLIAGLTAMVILQAIGAQNLVSGQESTLVLASMYSSTIGFFALYRVKAWASLRVSSEWAVVLGQLIFFLIAGMLVFLDGVSARSLLCGIVANFILGLIVTRSKWLVRQVV